MVGNYAIRNNMMDFLVCDKILKVSRLHPFDPQDHLLRKELEFFQVNHVTLAVLCCSHFYFFSPCTFFNLHG